MRIVKVWINIALENRGTQSKFSYFFKMTYIVVLIRTALVRQVQ